MRLVDGCLYRFTHEQACEKGCESSIRQRRNVRFVALLLLALLLTSGWASFRLRIILFEEVAEGVNLG